MHNKKNNNSKTPNFIQGLRPFSNSIPHGLKKVLKKSGYNFNNIVDNWSKMVGKQISECCYPNKVKIGKEFNHGTIVLNVIHGKEMDIEYQKRDIIDKINSFFGHSLIKEIKLRIIQKNSEKNLKIKKEKNMRKEFKYNLENINSDQLKNSLNGLIRAYNKKND